MPAFSANLTMLFEERPFLDRFDAARDAGFEAVEFQFPYAHSPAEIASRIERSGLKLVLHNLPAGDWEAGDRGIAALPDRVDEFRDGVARAVEYATALGCPQLNCLTGIVPQGLDRSVARRTLVDNLRFTAEVLDRHGIRLLIEAINTRDVPGFFLNGSAQAVELIEDVGSPNVLFQYDVYHMQIMEGDLARTIEAILPRIGHIQIADNPGRNEPGTGEIAYPFLFAHLDAIGYRSWVGCEYRPRGTTEAGLGWMARTKGL